MVTQLRSRREKLRRYLVFWIGLFIMSFGVSLVTRSLMGTSPISSVPYVWSLNTSLSMGTYIIILNAILIIAQLIMLGKDGIKGNNTAVFDTSLLTTPGIVNAVVALYKVK